MGRTLTGNATPPAVIIVGAGPVGLALAGDLAWRGVPSLIVERSDGTIEQPRMDFVGVRTMEFCRRWGIVADVEASPYPRDFRQDNVYLTSMTSWTLGREHAPAPNDTVPPPQSPQRRERCPQDMFDPILQRWATSFPIVQLRYRCEFVSLIERDDAVVAVLRDLDAGIEEEVTALYLAGCDGSASRVRAELGIAMSGNSVLTRTTNIIFRSPELYALRANDRAYRHIFIAPEGTWATIVAINGRDRWRMSVIDSGERAMTNDDVDAAIRRAVGADLPFEVLSIMPWTRRELIADAFGRRRVFIAGDAAHVMSPTGGFGMNTGIADAVDLSWKLDASLAGWGGDRLFASYTAERRPVALRNVTEASGNLQRMLSPGVNPDLCDDTEAGARTRERVGAAFAEAMRREWFTLGIHLGFRYDDSPVCVPDGTPVPPLEVMRYDQTSRPGARAPHVWLSDGRSTLDLFGRGFVLLAFEDGDTGPIARAAEERGVPLRVERLHDVSAAEAYERPLVLVRPDGMVAWRGNALPEDCSVLVDQVRGVALLGAREG